MQSRPPASPSDWRAVVVYTAARLALFAACVVLGWLVGMEGLLLLVVALLISGVASLFLLQRQRLAMSGSVDRLVAGWRSRARARTQAEDAYVDRVLAEREQHPSPPAD